MRRFGCLPLKIDRAFREDEGKIGFCLGLFLILYLAILLLSQLQIEEMRSASDYMEDALAMSNLAAAVIDVKEYGSTHRIRIADRNTAYEQYCKALKTNLGLNDQWESGNKMLISGKVTIERFIIYEVEGDEVELFIRDPGGERKERGVLGEVLSPDGKLIDCSGIYSEIRFPMEGMFGLKVQARKGKLVDIKQNQAE